MGLIQQYLLSFLLLVFSFYQSLVLMFLMYEVHEIRVLGIELDREQMGANVPLVLLYFI